VRVEAEARALEQKLKELDARAKEDLALKEQVSRTHLRTLCRCSGVHNTD
jgi:hypothetical protein